MRIHKTCLTLAILAALALEPVLAETSGAEAPQAASASNEVPTPPKETAALGEVTVTAQRREENVQKIPVAVAVVGTEQIERANATDISNLTSLIPSVTFSAGNELRNNSIRIRGVGTDVFSTGVESSVSTGRGIQRSQRH